MTPCAHAQCLRILCDNAKHNQSGKVEEQGAIRHRLPELCAIGALAMHFFSLFHIAGQEFNFAPEFTEESRTEGFGEWGRRAWYQFKVFFASEISQPMTYQSMLVENLLGNRGFILHL